MGIYIDKDCCLHILCVARCRHAGSYCFGLYIGKSDHGGCFHTIFRLQKLALSTSLASVFNLIFLIRALQMKLGHIKWKNKALSLINTLMGTIVMSVGVIMASSWILPESNLPLC
jgi:hypothetical protein